MTDVDKQVPTGRDTATDGPNMSLGLIVLALLISFVSWWMFSQGRAALAPASEPAPVENPDGLTGFRAELAYLPDEPLLGFVEIPAGPFVMGSDSSVDERAFDNERWSATSRQGTLELPTFYIGRFEVTIAQYRAFVADSGQRAIPEALSGEPDLPVNNVSWADALAYARWLQGRLSNADATPDPIAALLRQGWQVTLPTEAQWEKAARGTQGAIYPWGDRMLPEQGNYQTGARTPVGTFACPECSFGLADMSGNVWELTRSPFQPYPYSPDDDRANLDQEALWVMRGGSYADGPVTLRAAVRGGVDPGVRNDTIGFRLVISPD